MDNKIACFLLIVGLGLTIGKPAIAASFMQTNSFSLGEGKSFADDLWLSANSIEIKGELKNDAFLLAVAQSWKSQNKKEGNLLLAGRFENDVWAIGDTINLSGVARDHARLLAKTITISGAISNNTILAANSVHLTATAHFGRDVLIFGEDVIIEGKVAGDLTVFCKNITLAGKCGGNVSLTGDDIVVLPQTKIAGNLVYSSPTELILDKGVVLQGQLTRKAQDAKVERKPIISRSSLFTQSWLFLGALCVGTVMLFLFPAFLDESAFQVQNAFWKCMLVGFVATSLVPMACFFLVISLIGLPLAVLIATSFLILAYLSKIVLALLIGTLIVRQRRSGLKGLPVLGLGLFLLYVVAGTGLSGIIVWFLTVCLGLGGMIFAGLGRKAAVSK